MVNVLQTSDFHFGYSSYLPIDDSHRLITLDKVLSIAQNHSLLLICGDLFSSYDVTDGIRNQVFEQLIKLADTGTVVVLSPATHEARLYDGLDHGDIHVCSGDIRHIRIEDTDPVLNVYAGSLKSPNKLSSVQRVDADGFHIGSFYTETHIAPLQESETLLTDVSHLSLDFYALGGFHNFKVFRSSGNAFAAYSGSPETVYPGENKERYVISYDLEGRSVDRMKRLAVNTLMYDRQLVDCNQYDSPEEVYSMVEKNSGNNVIFEVGLKGRDIVDDEYSLSKLSSRFKQLLIHESSTSDLLELAGAYLNEDTLRGDFNRALSAYTADRGSGPQFDPEFMCSILTALNSDEILTEETLCGLFSV